LPAVGQDMTRLISVHPWCSRTCDPTCRRSCSCARWWTSSPTRKRPGW
jgi:hypothetical protein